MNAHVSPSLRAHKASPAVLLIGASLVFTILAVAGARVFGLQSSYASVAEAVVERQLFFEDRTDGSIAVIDARTGDTIERVAPGTNGFLRGVLRGLASERKRQGLGPEVPFVLSARQDGRLTLDDTTTQRQIDIKSFGPTNAAVFERLLIRRNSNVIGTSTINAADPPAR
jgi:putative photosynthetic complex assembly protein